MDPIKAPYKTSIKKCCVKYILEKPTKNAMVIKNNDQLFLLMYRESVIHKQNTSAVCPLGKENFSYKFSPSMVFQEPF